MSAEIAIGTQADDESAAPAPADEGGYAEMEVVPGSIVAAAAIKNAAFELDGKAPSQDEVEVARDLVGFLRALLPRLDDDDAAQALGDISLLLGRTLDDPAGALEAARDAFRRAPGARAAAHALRRAGVRSSAASDVLAALEAEGRDALPEARAALELARGRLLLDFLDDGEAAAVALERATEQGATAGRALAALERLAVRAGRRQDAAGLARRRADLVGSTRFAAEHLARAARHLELAGEPTREPLVAARLRDPGAPAVAFLVERGTIGPGPEVALREDQIAAGVVTAGPARLEVALTLRYRLRDVARAEAAFRIAADENVGIAKAIALEEVALLEERREAWAAAEQTHRAVAEATADPRGRALALVRAAVAAATDERPEVAIVLLEQALEASPGLPDAIDRLGRLLYEAGDDAKLERLHRLEIEGATSDAERAIAWRRLGELIVDDPARLDEALDVLKRALALQPDDLAIRSILERALTRRGDHEGLLALYEGELALAPLPGREAWLCERIAQIAADRLGDRARAMAALRRAIKLPETGALDLRLRLAELLEEEGAHGTAGRESEASMAAHAEAAGLFAALAARTEDPAARASLLERAAQADERRGAREAGMEHLRQAMAVAPPTHGVWGAAGRAFLRARRHEELAALLARGAEASTGAEAARWRLKEAAILEESLGRPADAIARLEDLVGGPVEAGARPALARLYARADQLEDLPLVLRAEDGPGQALRLATLAEHAGDLDAAIEALKHAQDALPEVVALITARLLVRAGRFAPAAELYERGLVPVDPRHARWRAAELRAVWLGTPDAAIATLIERPENELDDPGVLLMLVEHATGDVLADALARLIEHADDPREQAIAADGLAHLEERRGNAAAAIAARQTLVLLDPQDPDNLLRLELALDAAHDRQGLARLLRMTARTRAEDPSTARAQGLMAASVFGELGLHRDALDALDAIEAEGGATALAARLLAVRAHDALGDEKGRRSSLHGLARALPVGPERAWMFQMLGRALVTGVPDLRASIGAFEESLAADPSSTSALAELTEIADQAGEGARVIDVLRRAIGAVEDERLRGELGVELGVRLVQAGRLDEAELVVKRLLAAAGPSLGARLLACELAERRERWEDSVIAMRALGTHPDCPPALRERALLRTARVQHDRLHDRVSARMSALEVISLAAADLSGLEVQLEASAIAGEPQGEADVLRKLIALPELSTPRRDALRLRLAGLLEDRLKDPAGAISVLGEVTGHEVGARLLELGERSGRWDLAAEALEAMLARGGVPPELERAARLRLAALFDGPLARPEAATGHYERLAALAPGDLDVLERLAARPGLAPARTIELHQKLLAARPQWLQGIRALHKAWLAAGDEDGAFLAESVLVGLGIADEDEQYFYRQRRSRLGTEAPTELSEAELAVLCPEHAGAAAAVLRALGEPLGHVFPPDLDGYGLAEAPPSPSAGMMLALERAARTFGVAGTYKAMVVGSRLGPAVEPGAPTLVLVPRSLDESGKREQLAGAGLMLGRLAFGGALGDPRRLTPSSASQLTFVLEAACELFVPGWTAPSAGRPVFEDIKRRLSRAPAGPLPVAPAARRLADASLPDASELLAAFARGAARASVLLAQDPAAAISLLAGGVRAVDSLPDPVWTAVSFALSPEHQELRMRHHLAVKS